MMILSGYKLIDHTPKVFAELDKKEKIILTKAGMEVTNLAKKSIHSGTPESTGIPNYKGGTLRQSINYKLGIHHVVYVGSNVHYAKYNEFGTRKWPNPRNKNFLKNACQNYAGRFVIEATRILKG